MLVKTTDGTPDAVKVARPVWSGGKSGEDVYKRQALATTAHSR